MECTAKKVPSILDKDDREDGPLDAYSGEGQTPSGYERGEHG